MLSTELLSELRNRGVRLWAEPAENVTAEEKRSLERRTEGALGEMRLRYKAPKGTLTPDLLDHLRTHKDDILAQLIEANVTTNRQQPPLVATDRSRLLPLSFAQQRMWFLQQLEPENSTYKISRTLRLTGPLQVEALQQALTTILARHEVLRTRFVVTQGVPKQAIVPPASLPLPLTDLTTHERQQQPIILKNQLKKAAQRPFNLATDLVLRANLFRLQATEHVLQIIIHHIACDGWSMRIFRRELSALYETYYINTAYVEATPDGNHNKPDNQPDNKPGPLLDLPIQYADFSQWQRQWLLGDIRDTQLKYWQKQLKGVPPLLNLPTDRPRPAKSSHRGASLTFTLSKSLTRRLKALSQQQDVTLFMTLLGAFKALLFRYTGQTDVVVGSPVASRSRPELEALIGLFLNTLVLRTNLAGSPTFNQLLDRIKKVTLSAYAHQDLPFEQLLEALKPDRNLSHSPWFQVMFILQNASNASPPLKHLTTQIERGDSTTAKFDLTLTLRDRGEDIRGIVEYSLDLFEAETIQRMIGHFQTLLTAVVADPDQSVTTFPIVTPEESSQLCLKGASLNLPEQCLHHLFEQQVARSPDAIATIFNHDQLTYADLNAQANQLAHYLQSLGIGPESLVGIALDRSLEMLVTLLAVLKAGGAYVPLDPSYPQQRLDYMASHAQLSVLITQSAYLTSFSKQFSDRPLQLIAIEQAQKTIRAYPTVNPQNTVAAEQLAYTIYTSGSTGQPKGVQIEHRAVVNLLHAMAQQLKLTAADRLLAVTTISFDIAVLELYLPLMLGACVILADRASAADGARLSALIAQSEATVMQATPATWQMLLAAKWQGQPALTILCGGEALSDSLAKKLLRCGRSLWNLYGPTEATVWAAAHRITAAGRLKGGVPIAGPLANTQLRVLSTASSTTLLPVPMGVPGEVHIGGTGLARGYLGELELTQARFIADPFSHCPQARLYKTGDLARLRSDGTLEFLGRIDHQVKLRGYRVELGEVEAALRCHQAVQQTAVLLREDQGNGPQLVAYWVPNTAIASPAAPAAAIAFRQYLSRTLPDYMIPSAFVPLASLPLTDNGKVNRRALPAPNETNRPSLPSSAAPRNSLEQTIASVWAEILDLAQVGIYDNFFELGGHSLLAAQAMARIQSVCKLDLPLALLFECPTVAELAERAAAGAISEDKSLDRERLAIALQVGDHDTPPLFLIHDADGDISLYGNLAARTGDRTVYGIRPRSAPGVPIVYSRIEAIAADYRQQIQAIQPHGPYLLGGLCLGGRLAFEVALQLEAQGEPVALVALLDSLSKGVKISEEYRARFIRHRENNTRILAALGLFKQGVLGGWRAIAALIQILRDNANYIKDKLIARTKVRLFRYYYDGQAKPLPAFLSGLSVRQVLTFAVKDYLPKGSLKGMALLVKAAYGMSKAEPAYDQMCEDPQFGWSKSTQSLKIKAVSGGHSTMLSAEKIDELAEILSKAIAKALQRSQSALYDHTQNEPTQKASSGKLPSFSVIIPTYQRQEQVLAAVQSFCRQTFSGEFEVIVVVDGSTDGSVTALQQLQTPFSLRIIEQINQGAASARNQGAKAAKGNILLFLDDDMCADANLLAAHASAYQTGADAVLGHIPLHPLSPKTVLSAGVESWAERRAQTISSSGHSLTIHDFLTGQLSLRKETFYAVGKFDPKFTEDGAYGNEDTDFGYRLFSQNRKIVFEEAAISWHYFTTTPKQHLHRHYQKGLSDVAFARKHPEQAAVIFQLNQADSLASRLLWQPLAISSPLLNPLVRPLQQLAIALTEGGIQNGSTAKLKNFFARHLMDVCGQIQYHKGIHDAGGIPKPHPVRVLAYHAITDLLADPVLSNYAIPPAAFEQQLDALSRRGFHFISGQEFINFLNGKGGLPRKPVLVTFDDGYQDLSHTALPILKKRGISPIAFAITHKIGGTNDWDTPRGAQTLALLDSTTLCQLEAQQVTIGSHTRSHRKLSEVPSDELLAELSGSRTDLLNLGMRSPQMMAYPYGDYSLVVQAAAIKAGYRAAFTVNAGRVKQNQNPYELPRLEMMRTDSGWRFWLKVLTSGHFPIGKR